MQCYECGAVVRPGSKLCSNCGARLDAESPGVQNSWDDDPGRGRRGTSRDRDSRQNNPDPLDDPRAPRFLKQSEPPSRWREGGSRDASWHASRDDQSRGVAPERRAGPYRGDSDDSDDSDEYPQPRGKRQREVIYDSRTPRSESRDAGRGLRGNDGLSGYGGRSGRGSPEQPYGRPGRRSATFVESELLDSREQPAGPGSRGRARRLPPASQEYRTLRPQAPLRARAAVPTRSSAKPRGRRILAIIAAAVLLALAVVAIGAVRDRSLDKALLSRLTGGSNASDNAPPFITYTPGPTPTAPPDYKEFDSAHSQYVLDYPQSWSISGSTTPSYGTYDYVDEFTGSSPVASVTIEESGAFSSITRSEIIQAEVRGASTSGGTFTLIANPITTVEIAGEQWLRSDYLVTDKDGASFHMAILACHHKQRGYAIVLLSPPNNFSQDTQTAFEPMLDSLHFTG